MPDLTPVLSALGVTTLDAALAEVARLKALEPKRERCGNCEGTGERELKYIGRFICKTCGGKGTI